jgi:hypothetical protein
MPTIRSRSFWFSLFLVVAFNFALAERVTICPRGRYINSSGVACRYQTQAGEQFIVDASYYDSSPDDATVSVPQLGRSVLVPANQSRRISHQVLTNQVFGVDVNYTIRNYSNSGDYLDIDVWSDRSNLGLIPPYLDPAGDMVYGFNVTTNTPFRPVGYVTAELWAGREGAPPTQKLAERSLNECVNRSNCTAWFRDSFAQRNTIQTGLTHLSLFINRGQGHAETNTGDNEARIYLNDFFSEKIPTIMRNIGSGWSMAGRFLSYWFGYRSVIKNPSIAGVDWNLPIRRPTNTDWTINRSNAADDRIIRQFNNLIDPNFFDTPASRMVLREIVIDRFNQNQSARTISLSDPYVFGDEQGYHSQHIRNITGQPGGYASSPLDAITGTLGGFSFYLVPIGTVEKIDAAYYRVTINQVAVHVVDSFDFNGTQPLGCWSEPNVVQLTSFGGGTCVSNASFRDYRRIKVRGQDYTAFLSPAIRNLSSPLVYRLRRP